MISIIIPVYNPKPEILKRCLNSILNQEYQEFEIILVNDGSTNPNREWFEALKQIDSRVKVYFQTNKGVSAARNVGITCATGEYVAFVDGDDEIDPRFLTESVNYAITADADLVIGTMQYVSNNTPQLISESSIVYTFNSDNMFELRRSHLDIKPRVMPYVVLGSPCARLIKRECLTKLRFNEQISIFEDQVFNRELMLNVNKAVYINHIWYYYYQYDDSSMHSALNNGRKETRLRLDYLAEWNRINLLETDDYTKKTLIYKSLRQFIAAANYWTIQKPKQIDRSLAVAKMNDLYKQLHMDGILREYKKSHNIMDSNIILFFLIERKMFNSLYYLLQIFNHIQHKNDPSHISVGKNL